jgi:hypothetical protein
MGLQTLPAQDLGQYEYIKLGESKYRHSKEYKAGNKYQKDAVWKYIRETYGRE